MAGCFKQVAKDAVKSVWSNSDGWRIIQEMIRHKVNLFKYILIGTGILLHFNSLNRRPRVLYWDV